CGFPCLFQRRVFLRCRWIVPCPLDKRERAPTGSDGGNGRTGGPCQVYGGVREDRRGADSASPLSYRDQPHPAALATLLAAVGSSGGDEGSAGRGTSPRVGGRKLGARS